MRSFKFSFVFVLSVLGILVSGCDTQAKVATQNFSSDRDAQEKDTEWEKELNKKMDTAIKVLEAVKEEIAKEEKKTVTQQVGSTGAAKSDTEKVKDTVKEKADLSARIITRVDKVVSQETGQMPSVSEKEAKELTEKLNKSVDAVANVTEKVAKVMAEYSTVPITGDNTTSPSVTAQLEQTIKVLGAIKEGIKESASSDESTVSGAVQNMGNTTQPNK